MKKIILTTGLTVALAASALAQGFMSFDNFNTFVTTGTISNPGLSGWYLGADYSVEAYMATGYGAAEGALQPIAASLTTFLGASPTSALNQAGDGSGFFGAGGVNTGLPTGAATLQVRAWYNGGLYATYQAAVNAGVNAGKSTIYDITLVANNAPSYPDLTTGLGQAGGGQLGAFTVQSAIPEPSTFALAGIGAAALLAFRRRNK